MQGICGVSLNISEQMMVQTNLKSVRLDLLCPLACHNLPLVVQGYHNYTLCNMHLFPPVLTSFCTKRQ